MLTFARLVATVITAAAPAVPAAPAPAADAPQFYVRAQIFDGARKVLFSPSLLVFEGRDAEIVLGDPAQVKSRWGPWVGNCSECSNMRFSTSAGTRLGCGFRGPRFCSTRPATPPTWKARRTS
jgi:hypothetical protein